MNVTTFFENHMLVILPEVFLLISASTLLLVGVGLTTDRGEGYPNMVKPTLWLSVYVILLTALLIKTTQCQALPFSTGQWSTMDSPTWPR